MKSGIRLTVCLGLVLPCSGLFAAHALVQTIEGRKIEGQLRFESGAFVVTETNGSATRIDAKALSVLRVTSPPPPGGPSPTSRTSAVPSSASSSRAHGLTGLYFNTPDLEGEFKVRYDAMINFHWGGGAPMAGINADGFSVRWVGKLVPKVTEQYRFHTVTDDGVRLWINDHLVIDAWREGALRLASVPIPLTAGRKYDLRMEMFEAEGEAVATLSWSHSSMPLNLITPGFLVPVPAPDVAAVANSRKKSPAGVLMVDGSLIAGRVSAVDDTAVRFFDATGLPELSTLNVAQVFLQPLRPDAIAAVEPGRVGVLLKNRDFIDGEFKGFRQGRIQVSSVLFGIKSYTTNQASAIVLRDLKPASARYELRTQDESRFLIEALEVEPGGIVLRDAPFTGFKIPASVVVQIEIRAKGRE